MLQYATAYQGIPATHYLPATYRNLVRLLFYSYVNLVLYRLFLISYLPTVVHDNVNPCKPSPCGPYSVCRVINEHAVCSCQSNYIGSPPACRPECMVSSECPQDKACMKNKCQDPCVATCGLNARCNAINHNPICTCPSGFIGDPFVQCIREISKLPFYTSFYIYISCIILFSPAV